MTHDTSDSGSKGLPSQEQAKVQHRTTCDGRELGQAIESSTTWLEKHIEFVNSLNVYPVPDGDTGTNMYLTMQAALREVSTVTDSSAGVVAQALAHGALMGARGNSGVILSQIWRGVAKHLENKPRLNAAHWAQALREGAATAYKGVMRPVEGTILTVIREASDAAAAAATASSDLVYVTERALHQARSTLQRTPDLLPVLKEAGVVDAGGQGLCFILEGFLRFLRGDQPEAAPARKTTAQVEHDHIEGGQYGYDIQFLISGQRLAIDEIRETLSAMGDSLLVVGDESLVKVHIHSDNPGPILTYATSKGALSDIVLENMQEQYQQFMTRQEPRSPHQNQPLGDISIVAVANGEGLQRVFESLGAGTTVVGGQTMNPSTEELAAAVDSLPTSQAIILPNNPNVILTAQQVQNLTAKQVAVVPTKTIPQGIGALLAFNYQSDLKTNADLMERAAAPIQTIEITSAVRSVHINGMHIREGQFIGLLNGELVEASNDVHQTAQIMLQRLEMSRYEIITIYWGADITERQALELVAWTRAHYPDKEVELVEGKQPYYQYIISVE
ncbi:MAG TPA: DAK2 domain-containing protein [Anaerolineae bacterium]|nr:DAK2 domain-containing protein [Anaerolineae bacterium]HQJ50457.1 DAK2 domain-containing protein [Anaerolineae bacterium]